MKVETPVGILRVSWDYNDDTVTSPVDNALRDFTGCIIKDANGIPVGAGVAIRRPSDEYDKDEAMRVSMKRAINALKQNIDPDYRKDVSSRIRLAFQTRSKHKAQNLQGYIEKSVEAHNKNKYTHKPMSPLYGMPIAQ